MFVSKETTCSIWIIILYFWMLRQSTHVLTIIKFDFDSIFFLFQDQLNLPDHIHKWTIVTNKKISNKQNEE